MQQVENAIRAVLEAAVSFGDDDAVDGATPDMESGLPRGVAPGAAAIAGTLGGSTKVITAGVRKVGGPPVTLDTRFDLASLTKVAATLPAVLTLAADGSLDLDDPVGKFFSNAGWFQQPSLADATIRQLLSHTSGLPAWKPLFSIVSERQTAIANVLQTALEAPPGERMAYSDLGFIALGAIVERVSGVTLDAFARDRVFGPLGLETLGFRPVSASRPVSTFEPASGFGPVSELGPVSAFAKEPEMRPESAFAATEDCGWRGTLLEGVVHDENAFTMNGVAGHAGLFGTAADVGGYARAWLRLATEAADRGDAPHREDAPGRGDASAQSAGAAESSGAGSEVSTPRLPFSGSLAAKCLREHVRTVDSEGNEVRRGLGWQLASNSSAAGRHADRSSFGHTGFTGTSIWIDPAAGWFAVLLTNRVHPDRFHGQQIGTLREVFHDRVALAMAATSAARQEAK